MVYQDYENLNYVSFILFLISEFVARVVGEMDENALNRLLSSIKEAYDFRGKKVISSK